MYKAIELSRITRLDDETIAKIAAVEDYAEASDQFGDYVDFANVEWAKQIPDTVTRLHYGAYDRIVYLKQRRSDITRIKRDWGVAADMDVMYEDSTDDHENFVIVDKSGEVTGGISIDITKYHSEYEMYPAEAYYVHGNDGGMCMYYDPSYENNPDSKPEYSALYDTIDGIFNARGNTLDIGGSFRNMALDAEMLAEIRKICPNACPDFEQQTPNSDFMWTIELIHIGNAEDDE